MSKEHIYPAYLVVRRFDDDSEVRRIGVSSLRHRHVEKVMRGLLINMNTDDYYVDDSEVDQAREDADVGKIEA